MRWFNGCWCGTVVTLLLWLMCFQTTRAFQQQSIQRHSIRPNNQPSLTLAPPIHTNSRRSRTSSRSPTQLQFMGTEGGLLGVGGPEVFTVLLVGYFVLGPSDLYKLVKEVGKFIQNVRNFSTDLSTTFESNMENTLQLEEIRKAQRELNDAFSFRRSINVDEDSEAFSVQAGSAQEAQAAAEVAAAAATSESTTTSSSGKKKKIRRRVKKKEPELPTVSELQETAPVESSVPDLEMPVAAAAASSSSSTPEPPAAVSTLPNHKKESSSDTATPSSEKTFTQDELDQIAKDFEQYTEQPTLAETQAAQARFQNQVSGHWNNGILENSDNLEPMARLMQKIKILQDERSANLQRLEDEFRQRKELEQEYYQQQRRVLEETITEIQSAAFGLDSGSSSTKTTTTTTAKK